ncbi:MAG TPA: hypothetical protein VEY71_01530, partial [Chitinophagales bacterium]|nr:hypothetical protein [Chitinophagales bacterium]
NQDPKRLVRQSVLERGYICHRQFVVAQLGGFLNPDFPLMKLEAAKSASAFHSQQSNIAMVKWSGRSKCN